ncbi:MAG TPA: hypothetical protein PL091_01755 [Actinomycetota bacterium]|nr:hypothetical protein [Actinomycetota bacterium]
MTGVGSMTAGVAALAVVAPMWFVVVVGRVSGVVPVSAVFHAVAFVRRKRAGLAVGRRGGGMVLFARRLASDVALVIAVRVVVCVRICHRSSLPRPGRPDGSLSMS